MSPFESGFGFDPYELGPDPEFPGIDDPRQFFAAYNEIQRALAHHANTAPETPGGTGTIGSKLPGLLRQAGIDPDSDDALGRLDVLRQRLHGRARAPQPRLEIPDEASFAQGLDAVLGVHRQLGGEYPSAELQQDRPVSLLDAIRQGHTDWAAYAGRDGSDLAAKLHKTAMLMADPIAYLTRFDSPDPHAAPGAAPDRITLAPDGTIINGEERVLAALCMWYSGYPYAVAFMAEYVPVVVETPQPGA